MLLLIVLFSFVVSSEQCRCYPPEWESDEHILTASVEPGNIIPVVTKTNMKLSWDAPLKRYSFHGTSETNNVITQFKGLSDYISKVSYNVVGGKCTVTQITTPFESVNCVPANAAESSVVSIGLGQLNIKQFNYQADNKTMYINVGSDGCTPISFTSYGIEQNGARSYTSGSFENLTVGLKDRSIFNIPHECRGSSLNTVG